MKKLLICIAVSLLGIVSKSEAQMRVNVNVNIGSQPVWGPVGYDYVEYYYLPDIEAYYYVPTRQFIYLSGSNWVFAYGLPPVYRNYNIYTGYKVVINRPKAYLYHDMYRVKYKKYKGDHGQRIIRYSDEPKYYVVKGHPKYHGNEDGNSQGRGHGKGRGNQH